MKIQMMQLHLLLFFQGVYRLVNMTTANIDIPFIENLPFNKARLFLYATLRNQRLAEGFIDVEVKLRAKA